MIKIDDNYFIDADTNCFMLKKKVVDENGKEIIEIKGYMKTIATTLKYYALDTVREKVNANKIRSITGLTSTIKELNKKIETLAKELEEQYEENNSI